MDLSWLAPSQNGLMVADYLAVAYSNGNPYGAFAVAMSVILEAVALSVAGAAVGAGIAWALYDGVQSSFGQSVFKLTVSPSLIGMAILWAIAVALLGGLLPSIRAARRPVVESRSASGQPMISSEQRTVAVLGRVAQLWIEEGRNARILNI